MSKKSKAKASGKPAIEGRVTKPSAATRTAQQKQQATAKAKGDNRAKAALAAVEGMIEDNAPEPTLPNGGASVPAVVGDNVLTMTGRKPADTPAKPEGGNSKLVNVAVDGALMLDPETAGNKTKAQRYKPEQAHIDNVMRLAVLEGPAFNAELEKLGNDVTTLQFRVALYMVVIAYRLQTDSTTGMEYLHNFMENMAKLGKGTSLVRTDAIKNWFLKYAAVDWAAPAGTDSKTFVYSKEKRSSFAGQFGNDKIGWVRNRLAVPFWIHTPEQKFQEFDFPTALAALLKKAGTYAEMKPEDIKAKFGPDGAPNLAMFAEVKKAIKRIKLPEATETKAEEKTAETVAA